MMALRSIILVVVLKIHDCVYVRFYFSSLFYISFSSSFWDLSPHSFSIACQEVKNFLDVRENERRPKYNSFIEIAKGIKFIPNLLSFKTGLLLWRVLN